MQMDCNAESGRPQEELILSCVPWVEKIARKYSRNSYRLEYDDLYMIGMEMVCKEAGSAQEIARVPVAYLCKSAENAMLTELRKQRQHISAESLDAPLTDKEGSGSLLELLASDPIVSDRSSSRVCIVRRAVKRLPPRSRAAVLYSYGFEGYGEHTSIEAGRALGVGKSTITTATTRSRRALQRDKKLCGIMEVEE
jgi:RNA polymerase sigma factor (sigma-70 family)